MFKNKNLTLIIGFLFLIVALYFIMRRPIVEGARGGGGGGGRIGGLGLAGRGAFYRGGWGGSGYYDYDSSPAYIYPPYYYPYYY